MNVAEYYLGSVSVERVDRAVGVRGGLNDRLLLKACSALGDLDVIECIGLVVNVNVGTVVGDSRGNEALGLTDVVKACVAEIFNGCGVAVSARKLGVNYRACVARYDEVGCRRIAGDILKRVLGVELNNVAFLEDDTGLVICPRDDLVGVSLNEIEILAIKNIHFCNVVTVLSDSILENVSEGVVLCGIELYLAVEYVVYLLTVGKDAVTRAVCGHVDLVNVIFLLDGLVGRREDSDEQAYKQYHGNERHHAYKYYLGIQIGKRIIFSSGGIRGARLFLLRSGPLSRCA